MMCYLPPSTVLFCNMHVRKTERTLRFWRVCVCECECECVGGWVSECVSVCVWVGG
jgi:hypothetical protein